MNPRAVLFLICLLAASSTRAQSEDAYRHPYPARYAILDEEGDKVFERDSAEAFAGYAQLHAAALRHDDDRAVLHTDMMVFCYRATKLTYSLPRAQADASALLQRARKLHVPALEAGILADLGFYCYNHGHYAECFEAHFKAYDLYKDISATEMPGKPYILFNLAECHYRFGDYPRCIHYALEAMSAVPVRQDYLPLLTANLLGMAYQKSGRYDSARRWFDVTYREAKIMNGVGRYLGWTGIAMGNAGTCWMLEGKYDRAIPLLRAAADTTTYYGIWDNTCGFLTRLARIFLTQGKPAEAAAIIPEARKATYRGGDDESRYHFYQLLSDYYKAAGDAGRALSFRDSAAYWQERFEHRLDKNFHMRAEMAYAEATYRGEKALLQSELKVNRTVRNSLIIVMGLGAVITLLLVRQRQQVMQRRQREFLAAQKDAEEALAQAKVELRDFAENIHEKNAVIEALEGLRASAQGSDTAVHAEVLEQLRRSVILTEDGWETFRQTFETVYPGFLAALKKERPECTAAEYRLMVLEKLQLSTKEMAAMLGVSPETIRSTRSRLKKKLAMM